MKIIAVGAEAPSIKDKAFPTNRPIAVPSPEGTPTLLLFVGYQTATQIENVVLSVRRLIPDPERLLIINVFDLQNVPRLMHGTAKKVIKGAYQQAAAQVPDGYDAESQLIILTDWKGKVSKQYGVSDVNAHVALVLVDRDGRVANRFQGLNPEHEAAEMIRKLLEEG